MRRPGKPPFKAARPRRRLGWRRVLAGGLMVVACGGDESPRSLPGAAAATAAVGGTSPATSAATRLAPVAGPVGDGFVVWESNRSGAWRIWIRDLAPGAAPRQLTPDEGGRRAHCCPHVAPDGARLAYLSLPPGGEAYLAGKTTGPLHLLDLETGEDRVLAAAARTYFENRAAVWRGAGELIYIAGDGRTNLIDVASGAARRLTEQAAEVDGWLLSPDLAFATRGRPAFSPYDRAALSISERAPLGGCQPYFSGDGRWGYWVAGAGGPINRIDLASGAVSTILSKSDPRTVAGFGYLYFPMFSADGRAFAYAASRGDHSHVKSDYEIFVAASDPQSLSLVGEVRRMTEHPGTDRFPDVFMAPRPLGTHRGEAPLTVELVPEGDEREWVWSYGDGSSDRGAAGRHAYRVPGLYRVEARHGDRLLAGTVAVSPARAPRVLAAELTEAGRVLRVRFDEEIGAEKPVLALASGVEPVSWSVSADRRSLLVRLDRALTRFDRLELAGVHDLAERPNPIEPVTLEIEPPLWPARRDGLVFLWQTADAPNLFFDPAAGGERAGLLEPVGRAYLDGRSRMTLRGGLFAATAEESNRLRWALQATNELALELALEPVEPVESRPGGETALAVFGQRGQPHNFALLERSGDLVFSLRVGNRGPGLFREVSLGPLAPGRRHLVVSYSPGRLTLDVDGERVIESSEIQGGFFHWRSLRLTFGGRSGGGLEWRGAMAGVAVYDRALAPGEARENYLRHQALAAGRPEVRELVVEARRVRRSAAPTLDEIRPYREALAVHEYEVERVVRGSVADGRLSVAHRVLLGGDRLPIAGAEVGELVTLRLEPFADQPQLASVYLANSLGAAPRFFSVGD